MQIWYLQNKLAKHDNSDDSSIIGWKSWEQEITIF